MKILITTDLFTTATNGVVTSVNNLCDELKKKGHDIRILTLSDDRHSHRDGAVTYIRSAPFAVYPNVRMPTSYRHRLIKDLVAWRPDVIHSQCEFFTFQFAKYIAAKTGAPIVNTSHTLYEDYVSYVSKSERFGKWVMRLFLRKRLNRVQTVIVPSRKLKEKFLGYGIVSPICVLPSGISLEQHKQRLSPQRRTEMRHALGLTDENIVLVQLGRLGVEKNIDELLHFFRKAVERNDNLRLLIVGDGPAREQLEKSASELGITDRVTFAGMVKPTEVQDYYQLGDIFVSASTSETQGLTYIEAAANGLPLLCRRDDCLTDVIDQGVNGYQYSDETEFLTYIDVIMHTPDWLASAGKHSEDIATSFDKSVFGDSVEKIYKSVLA